jgi:hypothetical protein
MFLKPLAFTLSLLSSIQANFYSSFLPTGCCWTNNCCQRILPTDVKDLGANRWMVIESGKEPGQYHKSPDGEFHLCACDPKEEGGWTPFGLKFNPRCLAVPFSGS